MPIFYFKKGYWLVLIAVFLFSCTAPKQVANNTIKPFPKEKNQQKKVPLYQRTQTREIDVLHTKLLVEPNWKEKTLDGQAVLKIKPYFFPIDTITLDAKSMIIEKVELQEKENLRQIEFVYSGLKLKIPLPNRAYKEDTLSLRIKYVAQPEKVSQ